MNITTNYHIETVGSGAFGSAVLKNGLNGGLQEIVRSVQNSTGQHPDGLRIDAPGFKPVLVVTSLTAWRGFFGRDAVGPEGCPYSRDETMGIYSGSSEVLGIKDEKDSG